MELMDFAIQMEKDGEAYYRQLAHRTSNAGLRTILTMLADEEVKHQQLFAGWKQALPPDRENQLLTRAKNIFALMRESDELLPDEGGQVDLYRKAQDLEKKSETFYKEQAGKVANEDQKRALMALAKEEERHYILLENIIEFVSKPQTWLEDAEFNHLEEY